MQTSSGLVPGTVIRRKYQIVEEIGRGYMATVYRAKHLVRNEEKALKVIGLGTVGAERWLKPRLAKAQMMRQLNHPHIVHVEGIDYTEENQPFVVMEYVAGESLRQRIETMGLLPSTLAIRFAAEACSALSIAHHMGILHCDIMPAHFLIANDGVGHESIKVISFGTTTVGNPRYVSPEQLQGMPDEQLDGRSDLYSLGLVLYEMLTGRWPFSGSFMQRILLEPMSLDQAQPDLSFAPELSAIVEKALARDRQNRFQTAEQMQRELTSLLDG